MPVGVLFELRAAETFPGEGLCLVGDRPELAAWDATAAAEATALRLSTSPLTYPRWLARGPVWFEVGAPEVAGSSFSFAVKFVKVCGKGRRLIWEDAIDNRRVVLPYEDGSIWIVSADTWNKTPETMRVTRATNEELRLWNGALETLWAAPRSQATVEYLLEPQPPCRAINSPRDGRPQDRWCRDQDTIEEQYRALSPERALPLLGAWVARRSSENAAASSAAKATLKAAIAAMREPQDPHARSLSGPRPRRERKKQTVPYDLRAENAMLREQLEQLRISVERLTHKPTPRSRVPRGTSEPQKTRRSKSSSAQRHAAAMKATPSGPVGLLRPTERHFEQVAPAGRVGFLLPEESDSHFEEAPTSGPTGQLQLKKGRLEQATCRAEAVLLTSGEEADSDGHEESCYDGTSSFHQEPMAKLLLPFAFLQQ